MNARKCMRLVTAVALLATGVTGCSGRVSALFEKWASFAL